jgi:hypothetical protein
VGVAGVGVGMAQCIYCYLDFEIDLLTDEHIIPKALGADYKLPHASCSRCQLITSQTERRVLRGHWLGIRKQLNLKSRHDNQPQTIPGVLKRGPLNLKVDIPTKHVSFYLSYILFRPDVFANQDHRGQVPFAKKIGMTGATSYAGTVLYNGQSINIDARDQVEFMLTDFSAENFMQFLAKIAHSYFCKSEFIQDCSEYFLPKIILGDTADAMHYIGGVEDNYLLKTFQQIGYHRLQIAKHGPYFVVYIQLFAVDARWESQPIYEVVVGVCK